MDQHSYLVLIPSPSIAITAFGITGTIFMAVNNLVAAKFFLIFSPLFMTYPNR